MEEFFLKNTPKAQQITAQNTLTPPEGPLQKADKQ